MKDSQHDEVPHHALSLMPFQNRTSLKDSQISEPWNQMNLSLLWESVHLPLLAICT